LRREKLNKRRGAYSSKYGMYVDVKDIDSRYQSAVVKKEKKSSGGNKFEVRGEFPSNL